ncbi:hypothetical protein ACM64Y_00565 [Novispirillum sp. DQ9]|uniref:hypothetical protein n=1 Tax=Novispirillum sp. DQ9 TaxID=3398612 RepID=UPI003C7E3AF5
MKRHAEDVIIDLIIEEARMLAEYRAGEYEADDEKMRFYRYLVYQRAIAAYGHALHAMGGMAAMDRAIQAIEDKAGMLSMGLVDAAWDGIGSWAG